MEALTTKIDMRQVMARVQLTVQMSHVREVTFRIKLAALLIQLAGKVGGLGGVTLVKGDGHGLFD